jgi:hypothetical protein
LLVCANGYSRFYVADSLGNVCTLSPIDFTCSPFHLHFRNYYFDGAHNVVICIADGTGAIDYYIDE